MIMNDRNHEFRIKTISSHKMENHMRNFDTIFGVFYIICMVFGTPTNFLSFLYFMKRKTGAATNKTYMTHLYRMITFIDILICFLVFPLIEASFFNLANDTGLHCKFRRKPVLFGDPTFCTIWGLLWNILPVLSVFLVAILSFSRCLLLLYPLKKLDIRKPAIFLVGATLLMVIEKLVAQFSDGSVYENVRYSYRKHSFKACYLASDKKWTAESTYDSAQSFLFLILLGLPVVLILSSFIATVCKLWRAKKAEAKMRSDENSPKSKHQEATVTVIIVTGIYIICNIPVIICHLFFVIFVIKDLKSKHVSERDANDTQSQKEWQHAHHRSVLFIFGLILSASYTLLVAVNSTLNPIVYFTRMKEFRDSVMKQWKRIRNFFKLKGKEPSLVENRLSQQVEETGVNHLSYDHSLNSMELRCF